MPPKTKRAASAASEIPSTASIVTPLLQAGGVTLDQDSSEVCWQFLLSETIDQSTLAKIRRVLGRVCKAWNEHTFRAYAGVIKLARFHSVSPLRKFASVSKVDCSDVQWLTNDDLCQLGTLLPSLRGVDLSGCQSVSSVGIKRFAKIMGPRLLAFAQDTTRAYSSCKHMRVTEGTIKIFSEKLVPSLEELSLTLGSKVKGGLETLSGHQRLRSLHIFFEGFTPLRLPASLPALRELTIKTSTWSGFPWPMDFEPDNPYYVPWFAELKYPVLERLYIDHDHSNSASGRPLYPSFVKGWSTIFPQATVFVTNRTNGKAVDSFEVQNGVVAN